jgi:hypothetical protein
VVQVREANNSFSGKRAFGWLEVGICPDAARVQASDPPGRGKKKPLH